MNVTMLLCDAAQVADGKLYILGGGWALTGPMPVPSAVAVKVEVDWHELNRSHHWELFLEDADGQAVQIETNEGPQPVEVRGDFAVPQPEGVREGSPVDLPMAVNFGPLPLAPSNRYKWRFVVDGENLPGGSVSFATRPAEEPATES